MARLTGSGPAPDPRRMAPGALRVRRCSARDRLGLEAIGNPAPVAAALCPSLPTRIAWALTGLRAVTFVAENLSEGILAGCVQFVRARCDTGTWMFGHWRVAPAFRRQGVGRRLIEEGARRIPRLRRLYSHVDWGNEISILAHERLGFERAQELQGAAVLGALATIGPVTPAPRLRPASGRDGVEIRRIHAVAMGPLWSRLFPGAGESFSVPAGAAALGPPRMFLRAVREGPARVLFVPGAPQGSAAGFVVLRRRGSIVLYVDPGACNGRLLAGVAAHLLSMGASRDSAVLLRGLPPSILAAPGPIAAMVLMGRADITFSDAPPLFPRAGSSAPR